MTAPPPHNPAESFAAIVRWLTGAVASRTGWALTLQLIAQIAERLRGIKQRFERLAARVAAGTWVPRAPSATPHRAPSALRPRRPDPLPRTPGWLVGLIPEANAARAQLEHLLRDPEMAALIEAGPVSMRRAVRSFCRMLGAPPPPVLALPPRPRAARKTVPAAPAAAPLPATRLPAPIPAPRLAPPRPRGRRRHPRGPPLPEPS